MTLLNFTGFETGDTVEMHLAGGLVQATTKRTGDYAMRYLQGTDNTVRIAGLASDGKTANLGRTAATFYSFYLLFAALPSAAKDIASVRSSGGAVVIELRVDNAGNIYLHDGASTASANAATLTTGVWYRVDMKVVTNGTCELSINGGGTVTLAGANITQDFIQFFGGNLTGPTVEFYIDDLFIDDTSFTNATKITRMDPDGNGTDTGWTGTYLDVDEIPHDSNTTFINSTSTTAAETVTLESAAAAGVTDVIKGVKQGAVMSEPTSTTTLAGLRMRSGATVSDTTPVDVGNTNYKLFARVFPTGPNTSGAWSNAALDALQVGVVKGNDNSDVRCTSLWAMVASGAIQRSRPLWRTPTRYITRRRYS